VPWRVARAVPPEKNERRVGLGVDRWQCRLKIYRGIAFAEALALNPGRRHRTLTAVVIVGWLSRTPDCHTFSFQSLEFSI